MDPNLNINLQQFMSQAGLQEILSRPQTNAPTNKSSPQQTRDSLTSSSNEKTEETTYDSSLDIPVLLPPQGAKGEGTDGGGMDLNASIFLQNITSTDAISARSNAILEANPRAVLILDILIQSFIKEGKTPEEATQTAQEFFVNTVDSRFEEQGVFSEPTPDHPKMPEILQKMMEDALSVDSFRPAYRAEAFSNAADFVQDASVYFASLSAVDSTDKTMFDEKAAQRAVSITGSMEETLLVTLSQMQQQVNFQAGGGNRSELEYLQLMAKVVSEVRQVMVEIQMAEGDKNKSINVAQSDAIRMKNEIMKEKLDKMLKMLELQDLMKKVQEAIKITVYVFEAIILIFGLVFLPLAPVSVLLAFAVGAVIMAVTVSLTETKTMDKIFDGITSAIDYLNNLFFKSICGLKEPPGGEKVWRMIVYQVIVAALIVVAVVLVICLGTMIGPLVSQVASVVINTIMQQSKMMEQLSKIIVKACGGGEDVENIMNLVMNLLASIGLSLVMELAGMIGELVEEIIKMVVQGVIELIKMVVQGVIKIIKMLVSGGTQALSEIIKQIIEVLKTILTAAINLVKKLFGLLVKLLKDSAQVAANLLVKIIEMVVKVAVTMINLIIRVIKAVVQIIKKVFTTIFNKIKDFFMKIVDFFKKETIDQVKTLIKLLVKVLNKIVSLCKKLVSKMMSLYSSLMKTLGSILQATKSLLTVVQSLAQAGMQQKMADFKLDQGLMDSTLMVLSSLIKLFGDWQEAMVGGGGMPEGGTVGEFQEAANGLTDMLKKIVEGMSDSVDSIANT